MCFCTLLPLTSAAQKAGEVITVKSGDVASHFTICKITTPILRRISGKSYPEHCPVSLSDLRYLRLLHCNSEGKTQIGELICNKAIASDLLAIFRELYAAGYPIERMVLIDEYGADDTRSMEANNTTCFNFRYMTGSTTRISLHGRGMAIDLNPLYNPYVKGHKVSPRTGSPYAHNRQSLAKGRQWWARAIILPSSLPHRLFLQYGFRWGGAWRHSKDYQHFEKP